MGVARGTYLHCIGSGCNRVTSDSEESFCSGIVGGYLVVDYMHTSVQEREFCEGPPYRTDWWRRTVACRG